MAVIDRNRLWHYLRVLAGPMLLGLFGYLALRGPLQAWLHVEETYDRESMREWIKVSFVSRMTLHELIDKYSREIAAYAQAAESNPGPAEVQQQFAVARARDAVRDHLMALGTPTI